MALKNVILFALAGRRYAVELRWVEEVLTLGYVTPVPSAPEAVIGVVNRRGAITPVLNVATLLNAAGIAGEDYPSAPVRQGDSALLLQVEQMTAALAVSTIDAVTSLHGTDDGGSVVDGRGDTVMLLDPPGLLLTAIEASKATPTPSESSAGEPT